MILFISTGGCIVFLPYQCGGRKCEDGGKVDSTVSRGGATTSLSIHAVLQSDISIRVWREEVRQGRTREGSWGDGGRREKEKCFSVWK
jgi:hypothetical protein